jgi:hypothetical protein
LNSQYRLGIDFGTSSTVAMVAWPGGGRARPLLFDGMSMLPSAVCRQPSGELLVGGDALRTATAFPDRFEPHPKRRIDDGVLLLGTAEVSVVDVFAAVLRRVVDEARRVTGTLPAEMVLTYPVSWAARRRETLAAAASGAGISNPRLLAEPVAASHYFVRVLGGHIPLDGHLLVYDLGAGTFDASLLRRNRDGFVVVASEGLADAGGLDVDAAVMAHLAASYSARDPQGWARMSAPVTATDRRRSWQAWEAVRTAKEALSRTGSTLVHLPVLDQDAPLGREQLDALARPILERTVAAARTALLEAGVPVEGLSAILLVGGASRMPLVSTLLHRAFSVVPAAIEQPELIVAEGSLADAVPSSGTPTPPAIHHPGVREPAPASATASGATSRRRLWVALGAMAAVIALGLATFVPFGKDRSAADVVLDGQGSKLNGHAASTLSGVANGRGGLPAGSSSASSAASTATGPGGGGAGPATSGSRPAQSGPTTASNPPANTNPLTGPVPPATRTWTNSLGSCQDVYLRLTRTAGSSTTWPQALIHACVDVDGAGKVASHAEVYLPNGRVGELLVEVTLEFRRCGGAVLETQGTGKHTETNQNDVFVSTQAVADTPSAQASISLASFEIHDGGNVWTAGPATATAPCYP